MKRRLSFTYPDYPLPLIPINFFYPNGKPTKTYGGILDSGSEYTVISKEFADILKLKLTPTIIKTGGGETKAYKSTTDFNLGEGNNIRSYKNIEVYILKNINVVLIGIDPVFNDYKVIITAYMNKINLNPRKNMRN